MRARLVYGLTHRRASRRLRRLRRPHRRWDIILARTSADQRGLTIGVVMNLDLYK